MPRSRKVVAVLGALGLAIVGLLGAVVIGIVAIVAPDRVDSGVAT